MPAVLARQHGACYACGLPLDLSTATLDHIDPLAGGGEHSMWNAGAMCGSCNFSKGARPLTADWTAIREAMQDTALSSWERAQPDPGYRLTPAAGPFAGLSF